MDIESDGRTIIYHQENYCTGTNCRVKDIKLSPLGKPRRSGLNIFDTRVDFPVPVQTGDGF